MGIPGNDLQRWEYIFKNVGVKYGTNSKLDLYIGPNIIVHVFYKDQ